VREQRHRRVARSGDHALQVLDDRGERPGQLAHHLAVQGKLAAIDAVEDATLWLLDRKADPAGAADVLAGADAYLTLMGDVIGGWMLALGALEARAELDAGQGDAGWLEGRIALYEVYAANVLGHASSRLAAVGQGGALLQRITADVLAA
jgi:hypothetical protein